MILMVFMVMDHTARAPIFFRLGWIWQCIVCVAIEVSFLGSGSLPLHGLLAVLIMLFDDLYPNIIRTFGFELFLASPSHELRGVS